MLLAKIQQGKYVVYDNPTSYIQYYGMDFTKVGIPTFSKIAKTIQNLQNMYMYFTKFCKVCMKCILNSY